MRYSKVPAAPGAYTHLQTSALLAVADGARGIGDVMAATGGSRAGVSRVLHRLRDDGLVAFEDGLQNTARPLVKVVLRGFVTMAEAKATGGTSWGSNRVD